MSRRPIDQHEHQPVQCTAAAILTLKANEDTPEAQAELAEFAREADAYLAPFAAPTRVDGQEVCFHCGSPLDSFKQAFGIGAAIEWGLVHGEGRCTGVPHDDRPCGWPYRGMHYAKKADGSELFTARNLFLAYMPEHVVERKTEEAA